MKRLIFRRKEGFTLIELLVVIAIIGVLASIVLASLNSARRKSRDARRIADIKQIQLALELYFDANNNSYPANLDLLTSGCGGSACIPTVPTDPLSAAYTYEQCSSTKYHLGAALEESSNPALTNNNNAAVPGCTGTWGANNAVCSGTAGVNQGSYCYDVTP
jgi:prepilin-type N-terminal cleavage/methylation domain-containing protein